MSARVDSLIQLMRLSGTDKVREYLNLREKAGRTDFIYMLEEMFIRCKRDSIKEAWPPQIETQNTNPCSPAPVADTPAR